ncbi:MAG: phosphoserine aminotransferase apoenzyme [Myxococcaceae bacterium]|nr:phosphoserine aminotransferase apoenzyme [Myxococcaceae bacterium]
MSRALNFNAGPATLPLPALERARDELLDFGGSGMSVMEHSHRGKEYDAVHEEAIALLRELYAVGPDYDVLFLQGGASQQFAQIPMNLLGTGASADYVVNGAWGEKAVAEAEVVAKMLGARGVRVAGTTGEGSGKEKKYTRAATDADVTLDREAAYLHYTSNETIHGVQYAGIPSWAPASSAGGHDVPLVCDMSSDFMWRPLDVSRFGLIYAGAQKNLGPSGIVLVLVRKDLVAKGRKDIPKIFQYRTASENNSLYNTPPTFAIYLARNVLSWVKDKGGLAAIEKDNVTKAELLYGAIDAHPEVFSCPVSKDARSTMNVVFTLPSAEHETRFLAEAKKRSMIGLKGHRSVGGIRVSLYNAVSPEWVKELTTFMSDFAKRG